MEFKVRNVQKLHEKKEKKQKKEAQKQALKQWVLRIGMMFFQFIKHHYRFFLGAVATFFVLVAGASYLSSHSSSVVKTTFSVTSSLFGSELAQTQEGLTNILLIGSGGEKHDGGYLTDSIIVASIHHQSKTVSMLSLPRDLYLSYNIAGVSRKGKLNEVFKVGMSAYADAESIGEQFSLASHDLKTKISEIIGSPIQYTLYIDFAGFVKVVDALGGVNVVVEKDIADPLYPGPHHSYAPFYLKAGAQTLSGETALKYVRSRHGNAGGDFGRSARQKQVIVALKEKGFSSGVLLNPSQIQKILEIIKDNFWTDLSWKELIGLVALLSEVPKEKIASYNITNTERVGMGWFLYTPSRDDYNGMSVLLPYTHREVNKWSQIQLYFSILSQFPELSFEPGKMHVFNTTKKEGIGSEVSSHLLRYGMKVATTQNFDADYPVSTVEYVSSPETEKTVAMLKKKFDFVFTPVLQSESRQAGQYYFLLGDDYSNKKLLWNPSRKDISEPLETNKWEMEPPMQDPSLVDSFSNPQTSSVPAFTPSETVLASPAANPAVSTEESSRFPAL